MGSWERRFIELKLIGAIRPISFLFMARMTEFGLMEEPELASPSLTTLLHAAWQGHNHYFLLPFLLFPPPPLPAE